MSNLTKSSKFESLERENPGVASRKLTKPQKDEFSSGVFACNTTTFACLQTKDLKDWRIYSNDFTAITDIR